MKTGLPRRSFLALASVSGIALASAASSASADQPSPFNNITDVGPYSLTPGPSGLYEVAIDQEKLDLLAGSKMLLGNNRQVRRNLTELTTSGFRAWFFLLREKSTEPDETQDKYSFRFQAGDNRSGAPYFTVDSEKLTLDRVRNTNLVGIGWQNAQTRRELIYTTDQNGKLSDIGFTITSTPPL